MPYLLGLPRELRDNIVEHVIDSPSPSFRVALENRSQETFHAIRFEKLASYPTTGLALQLVNRHLLAETRSVLRHLSPSLPDYSLDVIVATESDEIWPTWTCIPALAERINRVNVTVRLLNNKNFLASASASASDESPCSTELGHELNERRRGQPSRSRFLTREDGSPSRVLAIAFYWMLKHFLDHGPCTQKSPPFRNMSTKGIHLNFVRDEHLGNVESQVSPVASPETLQESVTDYLQALLGLNDETACFGHIVFERVGSVVASVEGNPTTKIDLGELLLKKALNPGENLSEEFDSTHKLLHWISETTWKRKELGFSSSPELEAVARVPQYPPSRPLPHTLLHRLTQGLSSASVPQQPSSIPAGESPFSREDVVMGLTSFYKFLAGLHVPEAAIVYPPADGWPTITKETFAPYGKTDIVIDLLRHIPYIVEMPHYDEQDDIYEGCCAVDYRAPRSEKAYRAFFRDVEFPLNQQGDEQSPPSHTVFLGILSHGRNGHFFMVDTEKGAATMNDWQSGDGPWFPIKEFFEKLKDDYRSLRVWPKKSNHVAFG